MPQKKVGLVENQLWQILLLIVRNPLALLHKSMRDNVNDDDDDDDERDTSMLGEGRVM